MNDCTCTHEQEEQFCDLHDPTYNKDELMNIYTYKHQLWDDEIACGADIRLSNGLFWTMDVAFRDDDVTCPDCLEAMKKSK